MLLGAGVGRRLLPLSWTVPKPALPVLGRPIGVEILHRLRQHGIDEAVINLHHLPDRVRAVMEHEDEGYLPRLRFTHEPVILGTGGGIGNADSLLRGAGPILIHNCDFHSDIDIAAVVRAHRESGLLATLVLVEPRPGYATVEVDADGRVVRLAGRPEVDASRIASSHLFTGCHVIDERVLDRIPKGRASSIVEAVYVGLAEEGQLNSFIHHGFWWEFGTPEQYLGGSLKLFDLPLDRLGRLTSHDPIRRLGGGVVAVGPGAAVQEGATVSGRVALGIASHLGEGAVVRDSIVLGETWIGPGSRLERVIVGPGVEIPAGFRRSGAVIARAREGAGLPGLCVEGDLAILEFEGARPSAG